MEVANGKACSEALLARAGQEIEDTTVVAVIIKGVGYPQSQFIGLWRDVELLALVDIEFFGDPRSLLVLSYKRDTGPVCPAHKLKILEHKLNAKLCNFRCQGGPWMWPLHNQEACLALERMSIGVFADSEQEESTWHRFVDFFRLRGQLGGGPLLGCVRDQYGIDVAYTLAWDNYYLFCLWPLALSLGIFYLIGADPSGSHSQQVSAGIEKFVILLWGALLLEGSWKESDLIKPYAMPLDEPEGALVPNPDFKGESDERKRYRSIAVMLGLVPLICVFAFVVAVILLSVVQLKMWLTFDWGDCIQLDCQDAHAKRGFSGWAAEVSSDILFALVFDGVLVISKLSGDFIAELYNLEFQRDHNATAAMCTLMIESVGKLVPFIILGFLFVPQWEEPKPNDSDIKEADCSNMVFYQLFGKSALQCLSRRINVERRREVLKEMIKGPFILAPMLSILFKDVFPLVIRDVDCWCCGSILSGYIRRILGLAFLYDHDAMGCLHFVAKGNPFKHPAAEQGQLANEDDATGCSHLFAKGYRFKQPAAEQEQLAKENLIDTSLKQAVLKPFDPLGELLQVKLSQLWLLFFVTIRPSGIVPLVLARMLKSQTDITKMLYDYRRNFPMRSLAWPHAAQKWFMVGALVFTMFWYLGLSLVVFNDDVWKWA